MKFPHLFRPEEEAPVFLASPPEVVFKDYKVGQVYEVHLLLSLCFCLTFLLLLLLVCLCLSKGGWRWEREGAQEKKHMDFCDDWPVGHQTKTVEKRFKLHSAVTSGPGPFCFTSTEARLLIRDGDRGGRGRESKGLTADTT